MITHYTFGSLTFNHQTYTKDLIIILSKDGKEIINSSWWRKEGHLLQVEDLKEVWESQVEYLIIGTGSSGLMKVSPEVKEKAKQSGISLEEYPTSQAVKRFNELYTQKKSVAGAFHLTC
ncbi:MAG: MTH938/NDUFAF3 family protein [Thermodesulfobacteriaceae bacterium]|nr:MTH938/NDUFAF3 family protein [Thermodesulfobacteriaceae bacterium]MCX8042093.1 MTH938/NDUFAF3 family protein [Thermodesulfobacteriaceae bacterium]MDW8136481.1 MTH938/NDUFAF3 family protein [Thermodesulfobacterium sp.]